MFSFNSLELAFLILASVHATAMTLVGGQTAGKALLGLRVIGVAVGRVVAEHHQVDTL